MAISNVPGMHEGEHEPEAVKRHIEYRDTADYLDTKRAFRVIGLVIAALGGSALAAAQLGAL